MDIFAHLKVLSGLRHRVVVLDCNLAAPFIASASAAKRRNGAEVWIEPVSVAKCARAADAIRAQSVFGVSPNEAELSALCAALSPPQPAIPSLQSMCDTLFANGVEMVLVKRGKEGSALATRADGMRYFTAPEVASIVSVSGAGDCLLGGFLFGRAMGWDAERCMAAANSVVQRCLQSNDTVP